MQLDRGRKLLAPWGPYLKIYAPSRRPRQKRGLQLRAHAQQVLPRREDVTGNEAASVLWDSMDEERDGEERMRGWTEVLCPRSHSSNQ